MKVEEIQIGDWVQNPLGWRAQVFGIRRIQAITDEFEWRVKIGLNDDTFTDLSLGEIEPITLTAEILEKNGFRHGCYVGGYYSPDCPFRVFTKTEGTCGFTTLFDDEIHFSCIFVHQLQHALSLCGIEKEITL